MPEAPEISVIVHHFREFRHLRACFEGWRRATGFVGGYEIILVDSSVDPAATAEAARIAAEFPEVRYVRDPDDRGYGGGNNLGARQARGEFLIVSNADIDPTHFDALAPARLLAFARENPDAGIVAPRLIYSDGQIQESARRFPRLTDHFIKRTPLRMLPRFRRWHAGYLMRDASFTAAKKVDWVVGAFFLVRRDVFLGADGFDEARFYMFLEDTDLCRRLGLAGHPTWYLPEISVLHGHSRASEAPVWRMPFRRVAWIHLGSVVKYFWKWRLDGKFVRD